MAIGSTPSRRSTETNTRLPSDFDILVPLNASIPECTELSAKGQRPETAAAWAALHS